MRTRPYTLLFGHATAGPVGDVGLAALRVFAGLALAFLHGLRKLPPAEGFVSRVASFGFPAPELFAWLSGFAETGGGILLALGLMTRPIAALIVVNMIVAVVFGHAGDTLSQRELPLMFLFVATMFALVGAGRYSVDRAITARTEPGAKY